MVLQYLQVLITTDQIQILQNQIKTTEAQLRRLETLDKDRAISPVEIYDLRGQLATEKLNLLDAENAQQNAAITLFQLMGIPYDRAVTFSRADFVETPIPDLSTADYVIYEGTKLPVFSTFPDSIQKKSHTWINSAITTALLSVSISKSPF